MYLLGFVQLCQTVPARGFSERLGVSAAVRQHRLASPADLKCVVCDVLEATVGPVDGIASGMAYRAARHGELGEIPLACAALSSERLPEPLRLASLDAGQRLWDLSRRWDWARAVHEQLDDFAHRHDLHHAVAFGALVSETTAQQVRAIAGYLWNVARGIVEAGVRLIPLPEEDGQHVLSDVQPTIAQLAARCVDKHADDIAVRGE